MKLISNPEVKKTFAGYPAQARANILRLRALILASAEELQLDRLEETLKWGEPSYLAKQGSTIRIAWKAKTPEQYAIYFKCTSKLVPTFRQLYDEVFNFEGNRAIVFQMEDTLPEDELKRCIKAGLRYHKVKDKPLLDM
ncbi:MAG: DUF1801 domain-containing protein [Bacteroidia bacterium]